MPPTPATLPPSTSSRWGSDSSALSPSRKVMWLASLHHNWLASSGGQLPSSYMAPLDITQGGLI